MKPLLADARVVEALADAGVAHEGEALLAMALEGTDTNLAKESWRKYLEGAGGKGPWADHAREHAGAGAVTPAKKPPTAPAPTPTPAPKPAGAAPQK